MADRESTSRPIEPGDPLENLLADIWERCLGRRPVDVRVSFEALGGTPTLSAQMVAQVEQAVGTTLAREPLPPGITIQSLAGLLRGRACAPARGTARTHFVRNPGGTAPPLFFLHGDYRGGGLYCVTLAARLGREQPLYAIAPLGVDGSSVPGSIVAMAERHMAVLRSLRPRGPYRLGGHCAGAVIAFEMARQLRAAGEEIDALVLVAPLLGPAQFGRLAHRLAARGWLRARMRAESRLRAHAARVGWFMRQPPGARGRLLRDGLIRRLTGRADGGDSPAPRPRDERPGSAMLPDDLWRAYGDAMWDYCPDGYDGALTIIHPAEEGGAGAGRIARAWATVAPRVQVRVVPGTHLGCITTHVDALAAQMRACLTDVSLPGAPLGGR